MSFDYTKIMIQTTFPVAISKIYVINLLVATIIKQMAAKFVKGTN